MRRRPRPSRPRGRRRRGGPRARTFAVSYASPPKMNGTPPFVTANNNDDGVNLSPEPAPPLATIAAALRRERDRVGISLTELARRAGIAKSTLSQLESGVGNPS